MSLARYGALSGTSDAPGGSICAADCSACRINSYSNRSREQASDCLDPEVCVHDPADLDSLDKQGAARYSTIRTAMLIGVGKAQRGPSRPEVMESPGYSQPRNLAPKR
jgi:hypothetical protein